MQFNTPIYKKINFILFSIFLAMSGCASGNEIFKSGYWVSILTALLLLGTLFYIIRTIFFSGTEHKP